MKTLKRIVLVIAIILAIPLVIAAFAKKEYAVERSIVIERPIAEVFDYAKYLKNQEYYSVWSLKDPDSRKTYQGIDGTVGFVAGWDSDNKEVGSGEQEIKNIIDGERIDFELRFFSPFEAVEPAYMITESTTNNQTLVRWGFQGKFKYPMNIMLLMMDFEKMIGDDLDQGLNNLKNILEKE